MGYIHTINITDDQAYLIEPRLFAVTSGTDAAITATITNFILIEGVTISLKITTANAANATLSLNNGAAKAIYLNGAAITNDKLKVGQIYNLVYDGTVWHVIGGVSETAGSTQLAHRLTFGAGGAYVFDGSADVTVPVYTGEIV